MHKGKEYPVKKVEIKDLSGAGDTFLAGFVANYIRTKNLQESLEFANKCATVIVQQKGVNVIHGI